MARPSQRSKAGGEYHHGNLRSAVVEEALKAIADGGVTALNMRTLARRLGVTQAALYHHFAGKRDLLGELAALGYRELRECLRDARHSSDDPVAGLGELGRAYVRFALMNPGKFRAMFGRHAFQELADHPATSETGGPAYQEHRDQSKACAEALGRPELAGTIERSAWSAVHGVAWLLLEREIRPEEQGLEAEDVINEAIEMLLVSLRARQSSRLPVEP
jgi:AcrR family transcriptional regulator